MLAGDHVGNHLVAPAATIASPRAEETLSLSAQDFWDESNILQDQQNAVFENGVDRLRCSSSERGLLRPLLDVYSLVGGPRNRTLISATLYLHIDGKYVESSEWDSVTLHESSVEWDGNSVSWSNINNGASYSSAVLGTTSYAVPIFGSDAPSVDVTPSIAKWLANPSSNFGWILTPPDSSETSWINFASSTLYGESMAPTLVMEFSKDVAVDPLVLLSDTTDMTELAFGPEPHGGYAFAQLPSPPMFPPSPPMAPSPPSAPPNPPAPSTPPRRRPHPRRCRRRHRRRCHHRRLRLAHAQAGR